MVKFKNIRIKMKGGKSRLQKVKVLASGKYKFVKNVKSRSKKLTKSSKKTKRRKTNLARRKRRRGRRKFTIPIAPIVGLAAGMAEPIDAAINGDIQGAINGLKWNYLGIGHDGRFEPAAMTKGLLPLVLGLLVHKFVGGAPLNLNRTLANAGVPFIRI